MKTLKSIFLIVLFLLLLSYPEAQSSPSFYPFKGFHVGITGQAEFINKSTFIPFNSFNPFINVPDPSGVMTYGWEAGIEFSYHFAKYFGVSIGMNFGTVLTYNYKFFRDRRPDTFEVWEKASKYERQDYEIGSHFPIKFEFHYPLRSNFFLTAEAGIKLKGIFNGIVYGNRQMKMYTHVLSYEETDIFLTRGYRDISKVRCDLLVGLGFYYKLPHGDLLRFTAGINHAFSPDLVGEYMYLIPLSGGSFAVKHDFIYTQISYIHTLNWQKAKEYIKNQEYSFASKKERREKILELLKN